MTRTLPEESRNIQATKHVRSGAGSMMILYGQSALDWWRTPPVIRDSHVEQEEYRSWVSVHGGLPASAFKQRQNICEHVRVVKNRLLGDLKGVRLPVHVLVDKGASEPRNDLIVARRMHADIPKEYLHDIGGGLSVVTPEVAAISVAYSMGVHRTIELLDEFCGICGIFNPTGRALFAMEHAAAQGLWGPNCAQGQGVYAFTDEHGRIEPRFTRSGDEIPWQPSFDRNGSFSNMVKRSPLTTRDNLIAAAHDIKGVRGIEVARKALPLVVEGSGSPLETKLVMLLCLPPRYGGEHLETPYLNRRISYSPLARCMTDDKSCVADLVWPDRKVIIEANGFKFHADRMGFFEMTGRTSALESMGYTVVDITYGQMADLTQFDVKLNRIASALGLNIRKRTKEFLEKRSELHEALFENREE